MGYGLPEDVVLIEQDEALRLFDFRRGRFFGLNPVAGRLLRGLLARGPREAAREVADAYRQPVERVAADLAGLVGDLRRRRLLADGPPRPGPARPLRRPPRRPRTPGVRAVRGLLLLAWLSLRVLGWGRTLRLWQRWHRPAGRGRETGAAAEVAGVVREAAAGMLWPAVDCKERALAAYQLLRAVHGVPARLVVGVEWFPFQAHAWAECAGRPVADEPAFCALFKPAVCYN
jgi:hypothetical protein